MHYRYHHLLYLFHDHILLKILKNKKKGIKDWNKNLCVFVCTCNLKFVPINLEHLVVLYTNIYLVVLMIDQHAMLVILTILNLLILFATYNLHVKSIKFQQQHKIRNFYNLSTNETVKKTYFALLFFTRTTQFN